jgi:23S rRNA (uracil1939-C5)-methyltransferase
VQKNQVVKVSCERLGAEMEGVCFHEGMALFVPFALPGEDITCRVVKVQKNHAFGKLMEIENPSPIRQTPPCPVYLRCGGCASQHMTYEQTLHFKRTQVVDCFKHIGGLDVTVPPVLGMSDPWHYRNKTALPVGGETGKPVIGFYAPRSHDIIDIASCPIANSGLNGVLKAVKCWMESYSIPPYQEETHTGLVRHVMARASRQGGVMAVIVINGQDLPREKELLEALQREVPTLQSLCLSVHTARSNVILGDSYRVLWGQERLEDSLCGLNFSLSPLSFFQINPEQTEVLYKLALEFASLSGTETVADVYCGAGTISLLLAKRARRVIGLETVEAAVRDARENALKNGIGNVEFLLGQAEVLLPKLVEEGLRPDVIVLDPPRKGVEPPVIEAIALAQPKRVVYVSCNPATQARDAALFFEKGYRITRCQPVDMFCWTHGVENVLCFDTAQG